MSENFEQLFSFSKQNKAAVASIQVNGFVQSLSASSPLCSSGGQNPLLTLCGTLAQSQVFNLVSDLSGKVAKTGDTMTGSLTFTGPASYIVSGTSIVASGFFGDGSMLTNVQESNTFLSSKTYTSDLLVKGTATVLGYINNADGTILRTGNESFSDTSIYVGLKAGNGIQSGASPLGNVFVGNQSGYSQVTASHNTCLGYQSCSGTVSPVPNPSDNVVVGYQAGIALGYGSNDNCVLGSGAGLSLTNGSNNIIIGANQDVASASSNGTLNIGNLVFGQSANDPGGGQVGFNTKTPKTGYGVDISTSVHVVKFAAFESSGAFVGGLVVGAPDSSSIAGSTLEVNGSSSFGYSISRTTIDVGGSIKLAGAATITGTSSVTASGFFGSFSGDGSNLANVPVPADVAKTDVSNTFTQAQIFDSSFTGQGVWATTFYGDGGGLTHVSADHAGLDFNIELGVLKQGGAQVFDASGDSYVNVFLGKDAGSIFGIFGSSATTGNVIEGFKAAETLIAGEANVTVGYMAGAKQPLELGTQNYSDNTLEGSQAGRGILTASSNTLIGSQVCTNLRDGNNNITIGFKQPCYSSSASSMMNLGGVVFAQGLSPTGGHTGTVGVGMYADASHALSVGGDINTTSSVTASAFFGDGSHLDNLPGGETNTYTSTKTFTSSVAAGAYMGYADATVITSPHAIVPYTATGSSITLSYTGSGSKGSNIAVSAGNAIGGGSVHGGSISIRPGNASGGASNFPGEIDLNDSKNNNALSVTDGQVNVPAANGLYVTNEAFSLNIGNTEGLLSHPVATDAGGGNVTISASSCIIRAVSDFSGNFPYYFVVPQATLAMTPNTINYVYVDYNGGSPAYAVTTNSQLTNGSNLLRAMRIYMNGSALDYQSDYGVLGLGNPSKLSNRLIHTQPIVYESGLVASEYGTRAISLTSGYAWFAETQKALDISSSNIPSVTNSQYWAHDTGGNWQVYASTNYPNGWYDTTAGTVTLSNSKYGIAWIYRNLFKNGIDMILGTGDDSLSQAQAEAPQAPPSPVAGFYVLVAKVIFKRDNGATSIQQVTNTVLTYSAATSHHDLLNLTDGDDHTQYALLAGRSGGNTFTGYVANNSSNTASSFWGDASHMTGLTPGPPGPPGSPGKTIFASPISDNAPILRQSDFSAAYSSITVTIDGVLVLNVTPTPTLAYTIIGQNGVSAWLTFDADGAINARRSGTSLTFTDMGMLDANNHIWDLGLDTDGALLVTDTGGL